MVSLAHRRRPHQPLGRIALRFAPIDFKSATRDGLGDDWPITYDDLAPYYDKVEGYIGVFGTKENVSSAPDGVFLPPPKPRCTEVMVKKACDKLNIICIPSRLAVITRSLNGRLPCHYCGQCGRGCITASNFSSSQVLLPPAMKTGKLTMITGAMAREILVSNEGKAEGISYVDKATRTDKRVTRAIVVAASACESARLLLNSKSSAYPGGIANSSGTVGRYLTDSVGSGGEGYFPQLAKMPPHNHDGTGGMHMYMPWWKFDRKNDFPAAITSNSAADARCPASASSTGFATKKKVTRQLKQRARETYGTTIGFAGRGEMLPNPDTYCEIDPDVVDQWAFPLFASISNGRITNCSRPRTCRKPFAPS